MMASVVLIEAVMPVFLGILGDLGIEARTRTRTMQDGQSSKKKDSVEISGPGDII